MELKRLSRRGREFVARTMILNVCTLCSHSVLARKFWIALCARMAAPAKNDKPRDIPCPLLPENVYSLLHNTAVLEFWRAPVRLLLALFV
jgi:hypothetical protein